MADTGAVLEAKGGSSEGPAGGIHLQCKNMDLGQRKEGSEKESKSRSNMAMSVGKYGHEEIHEIARVVMSCKELSARGGKPAVIANPSTSPWHHEKDVPKLPVRIQCPG